MAAPIIFVNLVKNSVLSKINCSYRLFLICRRCLAGQIYTKTVKLPKTTFPHRVPSDRQLEHDMKIAKNANFSDHYEHQRSKNLSGEPFVLHDGPPYANGTPHLGHAVNKILKDIALRNNAINGKRVHYVPGWDCHGLPIESKALISVEGISPIKIRSKAREVAFATLNAQRDSFSHWGVLANWGNEGCYRTMDVSYVKKQLQLFLQLYKKGYVFQDYKPVYWSPANRTALAEAELEYNTNHKRYCAIRRKEGEVFIVAVDLVPSLSSLLGDNFATLASFRGDALGSLRYKNPLREDKMATAPFLSSGHVTTDKGTGLVHSAPNHGMDDYKSAMSYKMTLEPCLVDEGGRFIMDDSLLPKELCGLSVLEEGSEAVVGLLGDFVVHSDLYTHSYPYDWRSKTPTIVRASKQWFINMDILRESCITALSSVRIQPESARQFFVQQLSARPHWCISRQRCWGVPIPCIKVDGNDVIHERIFMHGFTLDSEGRKMSKSLGNVTDPRDITHGNKKAKLKSYGVDVLRWWVGMHAANNENVCLTSGIFDECAQQILKLRNTFRFILGSLESFEVENDQVGHKQLLPLDRFMLHLLRAHHEKMKELYEDMRYNNVCQHSLSFITNDISAIYFQSIKDRLYCASDSSISRKSALTTLYHINNVLLAVLAPIIPHLAEEVVAHTNDTTNGGLFTSSGPWPDSQSEWNDRDIFEAGTVILEVRSALNARLTALQKRGVDVDIWIRSEKTNINNSLMAMFQHEDVSSHSSLTDIFQVNTVHLAAIDMEIPSNALLDSIVISKMKIEIVAAVHEMCPRCRRRLSKEANTLCQRCSEVLKTS